MSNESEVALRTILLQVGKTEPGKRLLNYIYHSTGYDKPNVIMTSDGGINEKAMLMNEGRRGVWLELRRFINVDILKEVEIMMPEKQKEKKDANKKS